MATLPITVVIAPIPSDFKGTPNELAQAIADRLSFETQETLETIQSGAVLPLTDQGPFLLNGVSWYVWDSGTGAYVPQTIEFQDDINPKPFRANMTANQTIVFAGAGASAAEIAFTEEYDPEGVFDTSAFIAPEDGFYSIKAKISIAASSGSPTDNIVLFYPKKNGFQMAKEQIFTELGNVFLGRTLQISTEIKLQAGDVITFEVGVSIGGGSGTWTIYAQDSWCAGHKIRNTTF